PPRASYNVVSSVSTPPSVGGAAMQVECECGKVMKVADKFAGKKIRCPACRGVIQVPDDDQGEKEIAAARPRAAVTAQPKGVKRKPPLEPEEDHDADEDEEQQPRRPKRRAKKPATFLGKYGLLLGIGGGAVVVAAVVLIVVMTRGRGGASDENKGGESGDRKGTPVVQDEK